MENANNMLQEHSSLTKRVFRGGSIILFFTLLTVPLGYGIRILYSHTLSIQNFGLFYATLSFLSIFNNYNDLGLGSSLSYFIPKFIKKSDYASTWNAYKYTEIASTVISFSICLIFFLIADWLSKNYFKSPLAKDLIYIFAVYHIADVFVVVSSRFLTGLQREELYSSKEFIRQSLTFIFSLILIVFGIKNIRMFAIAWAVAYIFTAVVFYYFVYEKHHFLISPLRWDKSLFIRLLKYGIPSTLTLLIATLIASTNTFLITIFCGIKEFGIYSIVLSIVSIPAVFVASTSIFLPPFTSHLMEVKREKIGVIVDKVLVYIPFFTFYFTLFILMFPASSIRILFGSKWVELAKTPLIVLVCSSFFTTISEYFIAILLGIGLVKERLKISLAVAVINLIVGFALIYKFGIIGAVSGNVLISLFLFSLLSVLLKRNVPFSYPFMYYLKLFISGVILYLISFYLKLNPVNWFQFILLGIIYTVVIAVLAYLLKIFDKKMVKLLINYCHRVLKKKQYVYSK